jgi:hypothetical protein
VDKRFSAGAGVTSGRDHAISNSQSADESVIERRAFLPSYFQRITPVSEGEGIGGVFLSPYWADGGLEVSEYTISSRRLFVEGDLWPASRTVVGYDYAEVPDWDEMGDDYVSEHLRDWTPEDLRRLQLLPRPEDAPETRSQPEAKSDGDETADTDHTRGQARSSSYQLDATGKRRIVRVQLSKE